MEFLEPTFTESERHLKNTLQLSDQALHRLQQGIYSKLNQRANQKKRTLIISTVGIAAACLLAFTTTSQWWASNSSHVQSVQGDQATHSAFPTLQESDHWIISLVPVLDKYSIEIKPKDMQIRRDVNIQLLNSFSSSGSNMEDGKSITYKDFSISNSTHTLEWVITWKDLDYMQHTERITFSR